MSWHPFRKCPSGTPLRTSIRNTQETKQLPTRILEQCQPAPLFQLILPYPTQAVYRLRAAPIAGGVPKPTTYQPCQKTETISSILVSLFYCGDLMVNRCPLRFAHYV